MRTLAESIAHGMMPHGVTVTVTVTVIMTTGMTAAVLCICIVLHRANCCKSVQQDKRDYWRKLSGELMADFRGGNTLSV